MRLMKLLVLPMIPVLLLLSLLGNIAVELSSYVFGPLMLFIFCCGIYRVFQRDWNDVILLSGIEISCFFLLFAAAWLIAVVEDLRSILTDLLYS